jgi:archaellum component FlaG (FlaF/FlaG flagellin family)
MVRIRQRWSILLLGLVLGAAFVACKKDGAGGPGDKSTEASGAPGGGDLALLPADSEVVVGMNVGQIQQSGLWKQLVEPKLAAARGQRLMSEFREKCGIDPLKMVSSFTFGARDVAGDKPAMVAVAHGLDKAKLLDCIEKNKADIAKDGGEVTRDGDMVLFKSNRGDPVAVQFTNDSTAVIVAGQSATPAGVKAVLAGGSSLKSSAPFLEMYKKVKTSDSLWALASGKVMEGIPLDLKATAAYGSLNATDGLSLDMRVRFATPDAATQAASMASAQTKQAPQYFDKAEATADGNELHVSVAMSGQKLAQLMPMLSMLAGGMPGMGGN